MSEYIDVVFDGPPSHESGRFVEVEDAQGRSINFGEWVERADGYWCLRIPDSRELEAEYQSLDEANTELTEALRDRLAEVERLSSVRCPDGHNHRWDSAGMCLECCNYATDLIDRALQEKPDAEA